MLTLFAAASGAAPTRPAQPSVGQILARYIDVTGGLSAWREKQSEHEEIEGRALDSGHVVLRASIALTRSGDSVNDVKVPEEAREGVYKGVAWTWTRLSGARIKRGSDREEAIRNSRMLEEADWRSLYPESRVSGIEQINGKRCYRVSLLPSAVRKTEWFDADTGLLVRRSSLEFSAEGAVESTYNVESWGIHDRLRQPVGMLATRGDLRYRLSVLSVSYNDLRQPDYFRYPRQVADYLAEERAGRALPNAEEVIERHIFESGGSLAYEKLKSQKITGTLDFVSRNIEARTAAWAAGDGRYYQLIDIPGMGKEEQGSDGRIAWERSPTLGPRAKPRRSVNGLGMTLDAAEVTGWRFLVSEVRTEALEEIDGHECYRVRVTARDGSPAAIRWYDSKTGLLYRTSVSFRTEMGAVPAVMTYEAYRRVDGGLKWPVLIHMDVAGQEVLFKADDVELNTAIDQTLFELPDEIRNIVAPPEQPIQ